jgi:hypothetical protein
MSCLCGVLHVLHVFMRAWSCVDLCRVHSREIGYV